MEGDTQVSQAPRLPNQVSIEEDSAESQMEARAGRAEREHALVTVLAVEGETMPRVCSPALLLLPQELLADGTRRQCTSIDAPAPSRAGDQA